MFSANDSAFFWSSVFGSSSYKAGDAIKAAVRVLSVKFNICIKSSLTRQDEIHAVRFVRNDRFKQTMCFDTSSQIIDAYSYVM